MNLTAKILIPMLAGLTVSFGAIIINSERHLEQAILEQVKKGALVFTSGVAREIQTLPDLNHHDRTSRLILVAMENEHQVNMDFAVNQMYLYDRQGKILAHSAPGPHDNEYLDGYHSEVITTGKPYISSEVEMHPDAEGGEPTPVIDVIVPVQREGEVIGGLEAEINLTETMNLISRSDDAHEEAITAFLVGWSLVLFGFLWWLVHYVIIRHVNRIAQVTHAIAAGNLENRVKPPLPDDEVGRLGRAANTMADSIARLITEQEQAYMQALHSLVKALETKDAYTSTHSSRVSKYSVMLGKHLGLPADKLELLRRGALMHDLGKIGIPDAILNKPAALTDEEYRIMQTHPVNTATIMRPLKRFKEFSEIAAWHHERWDGTGYPDGLRGEEIPLLARIVAIADTWDAMTGDRVYRKGMPREKALSILEREQDLGQWDPTLVRQFIEMVRAT